MTYDLAIIVLNYRTPQLTIGCLESLAGEVQPGTPVVVVDNGSCDGSAERIEETISERGWSSWASVLRSKVNGGFAAGNNFGIRTVKADAYLLLNSDTLVRPGALASLREAMRLWPDAGIIGAGLVDLRGDHTNSSFRVLTPLAELVRSANSGPVTRLMRAFVPALPPSTEPMEVGWVGFASVLIRRAVFDAVGLLDEGYFMYFEDVDFCRRARRAGWKVLYWPHAKVVHMVGGTSRIMEAAGLRRRAPRYYYEARARYFAKFYGPLGLWLANALWHLGRAVSLPRELLGRAPANRDHESRDIWTNALDPLRRRRGAAP
jgi:GT2 family glycosyltransferase